MADFPDELLDGICSFMDRKEICTTIHISSSIRRAASAHLLFRLGISQSDVQAGTVKLALSDSFHLILFVAHICPIQRLVCFRGLCLNREAENSWITEEEEEQRDSLFTARLARFKGFHKPPHSTSLFLWIAQYRRLTWRSFDLERVIANLIMLLVNYSFGLVFTWVYRLLTGHEWSVEARLTEDLGVLSSWDTMRIQMLTEKHTLVTVRSPTDHTLAMGDLRIQGRAAYSVHSALAAKFDWGPSLKHFKPRQGAISHLPTSSPFYTDTRGFPS
ncbi:hypothetical protein FB45DRAFT_1148836 [Roridomyces roridus]|uniref:F-box domain-containing protein n=1 Tax=Roridomyces roridus TaxID=1738132 RepID=A0AAD7FQJ0_9AGAR|nr:hypothetical protein FB45DRAFT_1148836 [Roridomyces roridus]